MKKITPLKILIIVLCFLVLDIAVLVGCAIKNKNDSYSGTSSTVETTQSQTETTAETQTTTAADTTAPVISGVKDVTVHQGETVAYRKGITVTDDTDPNPTLEIDADNVDYSKIGEYVIKYTAKDASGNTSTATAKVSVVSQEDISTEEAQELADEIIAEIIDDDMTDSEKLDAVWNYIYSIGYVDVDYGEADDWLNNAYYYLEHRMGNCRCVYASSRLLLETLGYKTMRIQNKEDAAQNHYWNLVSIDDGETWYHFDPTCWGWSEAYEICMVSDDWLLDYSEFHNMETYDWEIDKYPATPDENYDDDYFGDRLLWEGADANYIYDWDNDYYYGEYDDGGYYSNDYYYGGDYYDDYDDSGADDSAGGDSSGADTSDASGGEDQTQDTAALNDAGEAEQSS